MSSVSTHNNWTKCKYMVFLQKVLKAFGKQTFQMLSGIIGHEFLDRYGKHLLATRQETDWDWFHRELTKLQFDLQDDELYDDVCMGIRNAKDFISVKDFERTHFELAFALKDDLSSTDWTDRKAWFRGRIDEVHFISTREALITDYKTGWGRNEDRFQLLWYAAVMFLLYPDLEVVKTRWFFTRKVHGRPPEIKEGPTVYRDELELILEGMREKINEIHACLEIGESACPPSVGEACLGCSYRTSCKFYKEYAEVSIEGDFANPDNLEEVHKARCAKQSEYKRLDDLLKAAVKEHGKIPVGEGKVFTKVSTTELVLNPETSNRDFVLAMTEHMDLTQILDALDLTPTQIRKLLKGLDKNKREDMEDEYFVTKYRSAHKVINDSLE